MRIFNSARRICGRVDEAVTRKIELAHFVVVARSFDWNGGREELIGCVKRRKMFRWFWTGYSDTFREVVVRLCKQTLV